MADRTDAFVESARDTGATVARVGVASAGEAVADAVETPAVGVEPGIEGVSLAPLPVALDPGRGELAGARTGVTGAERAIADYGSIVVRETGAGEEPASLFPERHVAVLAASDIVPDMSTAFESFGPWLRDGGDAIIATGPSATADMGDLVVGAHGPERLHIVVVEDR